MDRVAGQVNSRRGELLELAAAMFAERGLRATTVRDIADGAGILSGSLYHHFASKEEMVDELLRGFLGGPLTAQQVGQQYLAIVLGGITKEGV